VPARAAKRFFFAGFARQSPSLPGDAAPGLNRSHVRSGCRSPALQMQMHGSDIARRDSCSTLPQRLGRDLAVGFVAGAVSGIDSIQPSRYPTRYPIGRPASTVLTTFPPCSGGICPYGPAPTPLPSAGLSCGPSRKSATAKCAGICPDRDVRYDRLIRPDFFGVT